MKRHLIVTNGDVAATFVRSACLGDDVMPWRDVLWEGPVPAGLTDTELARLRGAHLARVFPVPDRDPVAELVARDQRLDRAIGRERITLLLEPDLTDQLQLVQILDRLSRRREHVADWSLAEAPGPILSRDEASAVLGRVRSVSSGVLDLGQRAFAALRAPDPTAVAALVSEPVTGLRHLRRALDDLLFDLPAPGAGLSTNEIAVLRTLRGGASSPRDVLAALARDDHPLRWRGDWALHTMIKRLVALAPAVLDRTGDGLETTLQLTDLGRDLVDGVASSVDLAPVDRWWGGTHLSRGNLWRWDAERRRLHPPAPDAGR